MTEMELTPQAEKSVPIEKPLPPEYWQDKLAEILKANDIRLRSAYMLEKKRRGVHTQSLAIGIQAQEALRDATITMVKCLTTDEDREHFCKSMTGFFK